MYICRRLSWICSCVLLIAVTSCLGATVAEEEPTPSANAPEKAEQLFRRLFKLERAEQLTAVKAILKIERKDKQAKLVEDIIEKVISVIRDSRIVLTNAGYIAGVSSFPQEERALDALSNILENTAFLGDIIMRLPEITHNIMDNHEDWNQMFRWSLYFTNQTQLVDNTTSFLLQLVSQEMNYTSRRPNFTNPFKKHSQKNTTSLPDDKKKKKKKKVVAKGPRLSGRQLGDL